MNKLLFSLYAFLMTACMCAAERNIVFIITDDLSPTLGCYGDDVAQTPALDRLAKEGAVFHRAYATTASCSASRSVVMSGLHNHHNGQYGHTHANNKFESYRNVASLSLPLTLADAGYRTAQIGKYHVAPEDVFHFETYLTASARNPVAMANACEEFITAKDDRPFFLYFATADPHRGGGVDENFEGEFKPDLFGNLPNDAAREGVNEVIYDPAEVIVPAFLPDTAESRAELAQYYQSVARIDQGMARLIEILKEHDLYDKTMIVFTSDHGMAFPGGKTTVYEAGLRVPFIVRNPYAQKHGIETQAMISHTDITPSLLDYANALDKTNNRPKNYIPPSQFWQGKDYVFKENLGNDEYDHYHGKSWMKILDNPDEPHWDAVFGSHTFHEIQMYYPMRSIFDGTYKLIWNIAAGLPYPFSTDLWASATWQAQLAKGPNAPFGLTTVDQYINRPKWELYKVGPHRFEEKNLADDPDCAEILSKLQTSIRTFQEETKDPWVSKWDYE